MIPAPATAPPARLRHWAAFHGPAPASSLAQKISPWNLKLRSGKAFFALIRDNDSTISNSIFVLKIVSNS
jgi:hypothetical protein